MSETGFTKPPRAGDTLERDLVRGSWAVGGWAGAHAALALGALVLGVPLNPRTLTLRAAALLTVAAWGTAAIASWRFRRSFRMSTGFLAAGASLVAGVTLPFVGDANRGAVVDGLAHALAGGVFALLLWHARHRLQD
jgi:hypothetical protein